jgi:APA family basic amino acid/polyamine antiporter
MGSDNEKPVSLFSATIIVVANMIGTGVFTTLGLQMVNLQAPVAVLLAWALGGLGAVCGALCYGELGEYTYLSSIYHPAIGFLSGWISIVAGFAAPSALTAIALGEYIGAVYPGINRTVIAVAAIIVLSGVHLTDVKIGCRLQNVITVAKVLLIFSLICSGMVAGHRPGTLLPSSSALTAIFSPAFPLSLVYVYYAYSGWNAASYVAGEIDRPERNLPRALFLGASFVTLCYVSINFIFLYTVPANELAGRIDVGYLSARAIFGPGGGTLMTLLISLALLSSLSSLIMVGPRVAQTMSEDLAILQILAQKNRRGAPAKAIVFQSAVALGLILTATFNWVLTYVGFTLSLFACLTVLGVLVKRWKDPQAPRPFKTWGYPLTPVIFLLLNGWMLYYLVVERAWPSLVGLLTVAFGLLLYKLLRVASSMRLKNNQSGF